MEKQLRFLILENLATDAELITNELHRANINFISKRVETKDDFLRELETFSPDLVLSDYTLPFFNGLEALTLVKEHFPAIPVIIVTGSANEEIAVTCMKAGAADYVLKENLKRISPAVISTLEKVRLKAEKEAAVMALRLSEEKYRLLAENTVDCIWQTDMDLKFTYVNQAILPFLGYTPAEWIGSNVADHCSAEELEKSIAIVSEKLAKLPENRGLVLETVFYHKNGREIPTEISEKFLLDEHGNPIAVQGLAKNISERKQAEALQDAVYRIAQATDFSPGLNGFFRSIHQIIGEVMPARNFYIALYDENKDLIHFPYSVDDKEPVRPPRKPANGWTEYVLHAGKSQLFDAARRREMVQRDEVKLTGTPSAVWLGVPLIVETKTIGVMAVQHYADSKAYGKREQRMLEYVSSQVATAIHKKQAEEALRESEARSQLILRTIPSGFFSIDSDRKITAWNKGAEEITGLCAEEVLGQDCQQIFSCTICRNGCPILDDKIIKPINSIECKCKVKGKELFILKNADVLKDAQGNLIGGVASFIDITERKRTNSFLAAERDLAFKLARATSLDETLMHCLEAAIHISPMDCGGIYLVDKETGDLTLTVHQGLSSDFIESASYFSADSDNAKIVMQGKPVYTKHAEAGVKLNNVHRRARLKALAILPMLHKKKVIACLNVASHTADQIPEFSQKILEMIVSHISSAVMRSRMENEIHESEEKFRSISTTAQDAIIMIDNRGNVTYWNPAAERIFGYSRSEVFNKPVHELVSPVRFHPEIKQKFAEFSQNGSGKVVGKTIELIGKRKDGVEFPIELSLSAVKFRELWNATAIIRDISERKQAEESLRQEKKKAQQYLEISGVVFVALNTEGGITLINKRGTEILGYEERELLGKNWFETCLPQHSQKQLVSVFKELMAGRVEPVEYYENSVVTKKGEERLIAWHNTILYNENGGISGTLSSGEDITVRKKFAKEKEQLETQLRQSQRMEAIGTLAGGVAHDFNNMLTAILGNTELLLSGFEANNPIREDLNEIKHAGERAAALTRQLLAFSRRQPLEKKVIDLNKSVTGVKKMLGRFIGEDIRFTTQLECFPKFIFADPGQIEQVIMNLVVNARDAMPDGGKLALRTANVTIDAAFCCEFSYARQGEFICLDIQDMGTGIDPAIREKIFDPFFSTKGPGGGTGLGLSVVYGIVKQHDGWIIVDSEVGQGTLFKVFLPVKDCELTVEKSDDVVFGGLRGKGEQILLIEDEPDVLSFASRALTKNGYFVYEADCAKEALEIFKLEQQNLDLVFSDVVLPDQSGISVVKQIQSLRPDLKILLCSGYTDQKSQWPLIRQAGYPFIQKPYAAKHLLKTIQDILKSTDGKIS